MAARFFKMSPEVLGRAAAAVNNFELFIDVSDLQRTNSICSLQGAGLLRTNWACSSKGMGFLEHIRPERGMEIPILEQNGHDHQHDVQTESRMHPSGVRYGLSRGLLQLHGEEALLSDALIEAISLEAQVRVQLGRPPIEGNFLVDMTVRAAEKALENQTAGRRQGMGAFFAVLNRTMYYTLCRVAERARLAHKEPTRLMTNPDFWGEFSTRAVDIKIKKGQSLTRIQTSIFYGLP